MEQFICHVKVFRFRGFLSSTFRERRVKIKFQFLVALLSYENISMKHDLRRRELGKKCCWLKNGDAPQRTVIELVYVAVYTVVPFFFLAFWRIDTCSETTLYLSEKVRFLINPTSCVESCLKVGCRCMIRLPWLSLTQIASWFIFCRWKWNRRCLCAGWGVQV